MFLRLDSIANLRFHAPAACIRTYNAIVGAMLMATTERWGADRAHPQPPRSAPGFQMASEPMRNIEGVIEAILRKDSPIHDGAVLIEGKQIAYAGLILPLSGGRTFRAPSELVIERHWDWQKARMP